jgi:hypothetical protein
MHRLNLAFNAAVILMGLTSATACFAAFYDDQRRTGIADCERVSASAYESGLWLNPDGYRSYYKRSACFQRLAIKVRDARLCDRVRRRWALFSSSWGYSKDNCSELVLAGIAQDRQTLSQVRQAYLGGPVRLADFRVELNGNGRDYDIVPTFAPGYPSGYHLSFWIVAGGERHLFSESGFHLAGAENIRMFEYRHHILQCLKTFEPGKRYNVVAELNLSLGTGSQSGLWSPQFIEAEFPLAERTQTLTRVVQFPAARAVNAPRATSTPTDRVFPAGARRQ